MREALQSFIDQKKLFDSKNQVLLAVSGGVDSVVLCHLFKSLNFQFGIAHCNFKLRGQASDEDAIFVGNLATELNVPFHNTNFETEKIAADSKNSIQLVARDLRYDWLENIRTINNYDFIATAHHLNDSIETFIYNFAKGTGIKGLQGIPLKQGKIIRPLLFATKEAIETYATQNNITYRLDASNKEDKYARNKIRHHIIPKLKDINPSLEQTSLKTLNNIQEAFELYSYALNDLIQNLTQYKEDQIWIPIAALKKVAVPKTILFEILSPYGFNADQVAQIIQAKFENIGSMYYSSSNFLLVERNHLILAKRKEDSEEEAEISIAWGVSSIQLDEQQILLSYKDNTLPDFHSPNHIAQLNLDPLHFPLKVRKWKPGDAFQPLGMGGKRQKLQDFFTNQKLSRIEKEKVWIITTAEGDICWVMPHRIDERF